MKTKTPSKDIERANHLLRAAYDLLTVCQTSHYVRETDSVFTHYDDADCDGICLREDIACHLDIDPNTDPIPTKDHHND